MKTGIREMSVAVLAGGLFTGLAFGATKPIAHWSFDDADNLGRDSIGNNDLVLLSF